MNLKSEAKVKQGKEDNLEPYHSQTEEKQRYETILRRTRKKRHFLQ